MSNLKYTTDHEWAHLEGDVVTVGITDYAQDQLGELVYVELPQSGSEVSAGQEVAVIESVKAAGDVKSPVNGTVIEINQVLNDEPEKVNEDPTGAGWFYRVRVTSPSDLDEMMDESAYQAYIATLD
ncbi:MAG: glycine cleavage system protein H [Acidiferrobacteraceae bacterium]|jgi:glycine cleavage system H protein|nr:glycine cleavage system protein H [Acidiferrobacteraceae bacterium]MCP4829986.1 glycine cleavage system protein GcvH [Pseudomonadota bacterium]HJP06415.1 glycine cleavage system protein GcvH [Arenicellales bacterium]|tara:strand:+ start:195 stop:572 length:378 start_codon:yes stop_codon:yes gene_type:complete